MELVNDQAEERGGTLAPRFNDSRPSLTGLAWGGCSGHDIDHVLSRMFSSTVVPILHGSARGCWLLRSLPVHVRPRVDFDVIEDDLRTRVCRSG
jgi:hypothetical protein